MTDLEKAARMALEALFTYEDDWVEDGVGGVHHNVVYDERKVFNAITALRQALERPAQQQQEWCGLVDWEAVAADQAMTIAMMKAEQEAAVLAEREACARLTSEPQHWRLPSFTNQPSDRTIGRIEGEKEMSLRIAAAIRARGQA